MTPFIFDRSIPGKLESWPYNIKFAKNTTQKLPQKLLWLTMTHLIWKKWIACVFHLLYTKFCCHSVQQFCIWIIQRPLFFHFSIKYYSYQQYLYPSNFTITFTIQTNVNRNIRAIDSRDLLRLMLLSYTIELSQATVTKYHWCFFTDQCVGMSINLNNTPAAATYTLSY